MHGGGAGVGEAAVKQLASPRFMQCDISDAASIAAFADTFSAEVGALDVLAEQRGDRVQRCGPDALRRSDGPDAADELQGTVALTERMLPLLEAICEWESREHRVDGGRLGQVSGAERQAQFTSKTLTTEELTALADEFAADVAAGRHKANGWGNSNYGFSKLCVIAYTKLLARPRGHRAQRELPAARATVARTWRRTFGPRPPEWSARGTPVRARRGDVLAQRHGVLIQDD